MRPRDVKPPPIVSPAMLDQLTIAEPEAIPLNTADCVHLLHRDFETRSRASLKTVGAHRYAVDPSTEVLCCAYAVDDEPV